MESSQKATLWVHASKASITNSLHQLIHKSFLRALDVHATAAAAATSGSGGGDDDGKINPFQFQFHIAISGGSLPSFLSTLPQSFIDANIDPQWHNWHVFLADERLVPSTHPDSNLGLIKKEFLDATNMYCIEGQGNGNDSGTGTGSGIPEHQIYGINEKLLFTTSGAELEANDTRKIAQDYQARVFGRRIKPYSSSASTALSHFLIDCALLGFGPDGHTASLFPNHPLLLLNNFTHTSTNSNANAPQLVASIDDSPKPPPRRITLTMTALNQYTRDVIFVGAGESKADIMADIITTCTAITSSTSSSTDEEERSVVQTFNVTMNDETIYPCGMIKPISDSLHYITDQSAAKKIDIISGRKNHNSNNVQSNL